MTNRYDALSDSAKQLMENFDEIDLADMLADAMNAGVRLRAERDRFRLAWKSARGRAADLADARDEVVEAWDDTLQDLIEVRAELNQHKYPSLRPT